MANEHRDVDYIIVGQGLAGTTLAYTFMALGQSVFMIDEGQGKNCSAVAAGAINPLAIRTFDPIWKAPKMLPFAYQFYAELGKFLELELVNERSILKVLKNENQVSLWKEKAFSVQSSAFMSEEILSAPNGISAAFGMGEILQGGNMKMGMLLRAFRKKMLESQRLLPTTFDPSALSFEDEGLVYKGIRAKGLVFCGGHLDSENPFFTNLPFKKTKGQVLIIRCAELKKEEILSNEINMVPLEKDLYWVGATNEWDNMELSTSEKGREYIESRWKKTVQWPYEIVDHLVGIRPTVKDRRPMLGAHSEHQGLYVFNGLGTRGVILAPFFAQQLCQHILHGSPIDPEVDVNRFSEST